MRLFFWVILKFLILCWVVFGIIIVVFECWGWFNFKGEGDGLIGILLELDIFFFLVLNVLLLSFIFEKGGMVGYWNKLLCVVFENCVFVKLLLYKFE